MELLGYNFTDSIVGLATSFVLGGLLYGILSVVKYFFFQTGKEGDL